MPSYLPSYQYQIYFYKIHSSSGIKCEIIDYWVSALNNVHNGFRHPNGPI